MSAPLHTLTADCQVGIYDNCTRVARVYADRTVATLPYVKWVGNTGGYAEAKHRITGRDHEAILAAMSDECDDTAWEIIHRAASGH